MKTLPVLCCTPNASTLSEPEAEELASRFKALADPTRVAIVNRLSTADEACVCDLTGAFDLSQPTISHHLKVLHDAGLLSRDKRGVWVFYRAQNGALGDLATLMGSTRRPNLGQ